MAGDAGFASLEEVYTTFDPIALITVAPEMPGAQAAIPALVQRGIVVSCGHTLAHLADAERA